MEYSGHRCNGRIAQLDTLASLAAVTLFGDTDNMTGSVDRGLDCRSHVGDVVLDRKCASCPPPGYCNASFKALSPALRGFVFTSVNVLTERYLGKLSHVQSSILIRHAEPHRVPELKVTRKKAKPVNSGMFCPELVNPNNLPVMKWKVCGEKQMLWLLQCYYIHKIYFIEGGVYTGGNEIFAL